MHQNVLIQEDELVSWLQHPQRAGESGFYSGVVASSTLPHNSVSLAPLPPSAPYNPRVENFINFARLREHILTGVEPWIPVMREPTQVGSSATPSSSAYESCLTPATQSRGALISGVSHTFALGKEQAVAMQVREIPGTSSSGVCKAETEPIQIQPATETETADDKKRKERQETIDNIEESKEARGSTSRKRSRTAEMHNISERRRREKINEKMKALQELIPRCNKTDKASMLDDAIEYVKSLQLQIEMMSMGSGILPMMYPPNMQQFMPHMAMEMNRPPFVPFPRQAYMGGLGPSYPASRSPFPSIQASDHSRVHLQTQQPYQPQFPDFMNTYSQFAGLQQMPQPPPLQNQTTSQLTFSQASRSKEPGDQGYQPTGQ